MKNLNSIANDLFQKIRGRFPSVTIGDKDGNITNVPSNARFFDFAFTDSGNELGKVNVSLDEKNGVVVVVGKDLVQGKDEVVQGNWYNFLKELRIFAKKRMMPFDVRDINKSNLNRRDYQFLATNRPGEEPMAESRMYGTNKTSYQRIGNARLAIKHTQPINVESVGSRSQKIGAIYIESPEGERFKYPFRHLAGARAMARHVSEGGNAYDDFGKYVAGLSEEAVKLQKFKTYMGRSTVMAETLAGYMDTVNERIQAVKKEIHHLQKEAYYREAAANFTVQVVEEVPNDVSENWIDQLTIKQFNEELKDVFPYIYKLVGEATRAVELGPNDIIDESGLQYYTGVKKHGKEYMKKAAQAGREGASQEELGRLKDKYSKAEKNTKEDIGIEEAGLRPGPDFSLASKEYKGFVLGAEDDSDDDRRATMWAVYKNLGDGTYKQVSSVKDPKYNGKHPVSSFSSKVPFEEFKWTVDNFLAKTPEEFELEQAFEDTMGQFSDHVCEDCGNQNWRTLSEEKQKGVDGKVCWKGYKRMGTKMKGGKRVDNCVKVKEEAEIEEAYINSSKDAIEILSNLRKIGKSIELGQGSYDGNLAGMYVNDVYDVVTWLASNADTSDPKFKQIIAPVIELRKKAKGMEREPGSGKDAGFGNEIVNTLYPLMQWIEMNAATSKETDEYSPPTDSTQSPMSMTPEKPKLPLGEFILSYFDRESGKFPKGETAVLTAVQKDYGDQFVKPAAQFIKKIESTVMASQAEQLQNSPYPQMEIIKKLAGY